MKLEATQVRRRGAALFFTAAAAVTAPSPAAADSRVGSIGGRGGIEFSARCEEGEILTGLFYRAGNEFDAIAPICARAYRPTVIVSASLRVYPRMFGGGGGRADKMECGGGAPAIRMIHVDALRADERVRSVSIYCGPVSPDPWEDPPYPHAGYSGNDDTSREFTSGERTLLVGQVRCPPNEVAVGIHGRSGARLDRLGLICGTPVTQLYGAAASAPAEPPRPPADVRVGNPNDGRAGQPRPSSGTAVRPGTPASTRPRPRPQPPR